MCLAGLSNQCLVNHGLWDPGWQITSYHSHVNAKALKPGSKVRDGLFARHHVHHLERHNFAFGHLGVEHPLPLVSGNSAKSMYSFLTIFSTVPLGKAGRPGLTDTTRLGATCNGLAATVSVLMTCSTSQPHSSPRYL